MRSRFHVLIVALSATAAAFAGSPNAARPIAPPSRVEGAIGSQLGVDTNPFLRGAAVPGDGMVPPPEVADTVDAIVNNAHLVEASAVTMRNGQVLLVGDKRSLAQASRVLDDLDEESMQAEMILADEDADLESEGSTPHR